MKRLAKIATATLLASGLVFFAYAKNTPKTELSYSTIGHGPALILLHGSSKDDLAWAAAARQLSSNFRVTLIDISKLPSDANAVSQLRRIIARSDLDASHISGSAAGERLALQYALSYPSQSRSFTLPQTGEDLHILADLINSTPLTRS